jgi:hypothetical protein
VLSRSFLDSNRSQLSPSCQHHSLTFWVSQSILSTENCLRSLFVLLLSILGFSILSFYQLLRIGVLSSRHLGIHILSSRHLGVLILSFAASGYPFSVNPQIWVFILSFYDIWVFILSRSSDLGISILSFYDIWAFRFSVPDIWEFSFSVLHLGIPLSPVPDRLGTFPEISPSHPNCHSISPSCTSR